MKYMLFMYAILLLFSNSYGYKKKIGGSKVSLVISVLLFFTTFLNVLSMNLLLKFMITFLLLALSGSLFYDRKISGKSINDRHHFIRGMLHLVFIYFLYF